MDERVTRCWTGALALGRGSVVSVARHGLVANDVRAGRDEVSGKRLPGELVRILRKGASRPKVEQAQPGLSETFESMVDPVTRGGGNP